MSKQTREAPRRLSDVLTTVMGDLEGRARDLSIALRGPRLRRQRAARRKSRGLLTQCFRCIEEGKTALLAGGTSSKGGHESMSDPTSLIEEMKRFSQDLKALTDVLQGRSSLFLEEAGKTESVSRTEKPSLKSKAKASPAVPSGQSLAQVKDLQVSTEGSKSKDTGTTADAQDTPKEKGPPSVISYFEMVNLWCLPEIKIRIVCEVTLPIARVLERIDLMLDLKEQRITKLLEMVGVLDALKVNSGEIREGYREELLEGTGDRPLILRPKRRKRRR